MRAIQPLADIETRAPEAGRIRLGIKSGKAMKALDKFRFTSPFKDCIETLANLYGGVVQPWNDPKASPSNQWEVLTNASEIQVFLPPNPVSTWYELYSGSGLQRRCDGAVCQIPQQTGPNIWEPVDNPCVCVAKNAMECSPHTRLKVLIPDVPFRGIWRLETKGWNALKELPGMADLITQLNSSGSMVRVALGIEKRTQMRPSGKRNFVTPTLTMLDSPNQILSGAARVQGIAISGPAPLAIESSTSDEEDELDIIDAEIVEVDDPPVKHSLMDDAKFFFPETDPIIFWQAMVRQVKGSEHSLTAEQLKRLQTAHDKMTSGQITPARIKDDGTIEWEIDK